jgi:hypothetical protein
MWNMGAWPDFSLKNFSLNERIIMIATFDRAQRPLLEFQQESQGGCPSLSCSF